ncbi:hypothetical protein SAMN05660199_02027 [Klenkia soli]|uniref:Uncharacterized protein n=1 Tax=Klenkia soli TaxID=1052260 RepID=A0A1H0JNE1_9ACTN|nr:hypothetical protein [Klenkia soli]SDO45268.1 hypothetical protein SAMN05660199_02027 [Klenkia soli]
MRPGSFAEALSEEWSRWVLEHGLPEPPAALQDGESVPVAWWTGPDSAAVLHVRRWPPEDLQDADDSDEPWTEVDVQLFERVGDAWETGPSGGAGGWSAPTLTGLEVAADHADLGGVVGGSAGGLELIALWGEAGAAAATVEVEQDGVTTSRALTGTPGWVVVSGAVRGGFRARVRDASGRVLVEAVAPPEDW